MLSATNFYCIHHGNDTTVFARGDIIFDLTSLFNDTLCKVFKWLCGNYLCLHVEKTCFTVFTNKYKEALRVLRINNTFFFLMNLNFLEELLITSYFLRNIYLVCVQKYLVMSDCQKKKLSFFYP